MKHSYFELMSLCCKFVVSAEIYTLHMYVCAWHSYNGGDFSLYVRGCNMVIVETRFFRERF